MKSIPQNTEDMGSYKGVGDILPFMTAEEREGKRVIERASKGSRDREATPS